MKRFIDTFIRTATPSNISEIRSALWNAGGGNHANDKAALLEQYKIYVEMADRVSARRGLTNTFFLSLNTGIFSLFALFGRSHASGPRWLLIVPLLALLGECLAWFWLIRSYRQLNSAKFAVIGALEERLPASPYWAAEWTALGEGKDPARYWPLSHLEQWIPLLFAGIYVFGFLGLLVAG